MLKQYDILLGKAIIGNATIKQEGLYYIISCVCKIKDNDIYKVILYMNDSKYELGVCVPRDDLMVLEKKVSVRQIGCGPYEFFLEKKYGQQSGKYVEVFDNMAFAHIRKLEHARFELRDNKRWIWIEKD